MPTQTMPVKTSVAVRTAAILAQHASIRETKDSLTVDPFLRLSECMPMLNVSYQTVRGWIRDGTLKVSRPGGRGPFRCRLSEIQRFLRDSEVKCG
jgi:excisionase family DNA binding protein